MTDYRDKWITCDDVGIHVRGYYFPWGTKTIPYASVQAVRRAPVGTLTGRGRVWGTTNPRYWANLDPARPRKTTALVLDTGHAVRPFLTPDEPDAVLAAIRSHAPGVRVEDGPGTVV